jgi:regulator of RNase E activity RraB
MPAKFEKLGISFQYPDNWTLDEEDALAGRNSVTVYSPGGAFWSVAVHPRSADPAQLAKAAVDAMKQEYEELEVEETCEAVAGREIIGYDLNFYCLDFINTARIRCLRTDQTTYAIFCQAEDREFDRVQLVFQAMTASLLSGLKKLTRWD